MANTYDYLEPKTQPIHYIVNKEIGKIKEELISNKIYHEYKIGIDLHQEEFMNGFKALHKEDSDLHTAGQDADTLLKNIFLLRQGKFEGKKKISHRACCILAQHRFCVCLESFSCPVHGDTCHGTHD